MNLDDGVDFDSSDADGNPINYRKLAEDLANKNVKLECAISALESDNKFLDNELRLRLLRIQQLEKLLLVCANEFESLNIVEPSQHFSDLSQLCYSTIFGDVDA